MALTWRRSGGRLAPVVPAGPGRWSTGP